MESIQIDNRLIELIQRCEIMVQLTTRATGYWNVIRMTFQMPLILTSSATPSISSYLFCFTNLANEDDKNPKLSLNIKWSNPKDMIFQNSVQ